MNEKPYLSLRWQLFPLVLRLFVPKAKPRDESPIKRVVCIRPGKVGDMIVASPIFSALKQVGGVEHIALICSSANEVIVRHNPFINEIKVVNFHRIGQVVSTIRWLRYCKFDAIVDLSPGFSRTNLMMSYFGGRDSIRVGIQKGRLASRYHVHVSETDVPLAEQYIAAGAELTRKKNDRPLMYEIYSNEQARVAAAQLTGQFKQPIVAINLSAGHEQRIWPFDRFAELITLFRSHYAKISLFLVGVGEQELWARKLARENASCFSATHLPFLAVVELIGRSCLLISADTSLIHAAAARGVPVVGLYNAHKRNSVLWRPYGVPFRMVQGAYKNRISDITAAMVFKSANELMYENGF